MKIVVCFCLLLGLSVTTTYAQFTEGFQKREYLELMRITAASIDTPWTQLKLKPLYSEIFFRSKVVGLDNQADLWLRDDGVIILSLRGTTKKDISWLENFYAAQIPAQGSIQLASDYTYTYHFAEESRAAVHVGWTIGAGFLLREVLPQLDSCYQAGARNLIVVGHSQGAALSFLVTSQLRYWQKQGKFPAGWQLKTYASAAPKPGNLYYAYDYEQLTYGGYGITVLNPLDWVPEVPVTVQTLTDFTPTNPFRDAKKVFKKQPFVKRLALSYGYKRLTKPTQRAQKNYTKYLGKTASSMLKTTLPGYVAPKYVPSTLYTRAGSPIVLRPNAAYRSERVDPNKNVFIHHMPEAYYRLAELLPD